jgi:hypothetical protein
MPQPLNRASRLTELPAANAITNASLFYVVNDGGSMHVNGSVLAAYLLSLINDTD